VASCQSVIRIATLSMTQYISRRLSAVSLSLLRFCDSCEYPLVTTSRSLIEYWLLTAGYWPLVVVPFS